MPEEHIKPEPDTLVFSSTHLQYLMPGFPLWPGRPTCDCLPESVAVHHADAEYVGLTSYFHCVTSSL